MVRSSFYTLYTVIIYSLLRVGSRFRRTVAAFLPYCFGFDPRPVHVKFMVVKVEIGEVSL